MLSKFLDPKNEAATKAAQTTENQTHVAISMHKRSCVRALDKVIFMQQDAVNPATMQEYLSRWSTWWRRSAALSYVENIIAWTKHTLTLDPKLAKLGSSLLFGYPAKLATAGDAPELILS